MGKQDKPPVEVIFFEFVVKEHLKRAIFSAVNDVLHAEMPEVLDNLSLEESRELDQKTLTILEKVFPEIILNLHEELANLAKSYDQAKEIDPLAN